MIRAYHEAGISVVLGGLQSYLFDRIWSLSKIQCPTIITVDGARWSFPNGTGVGE